MGASSYCESDIEAEELGEKDVAGLRGKNTEAQRGCEKIRVLAILMKFFSRF